MKPDADVIDTITDEITQSVHSIELRHVKGHQDKSKKIADLPQPARLNVRADELATKALEQQQTQFQTLKYNTYLYWKNKPVTKGEKSTIRKAVHKDALQKKLLNTVKVSFTVDWDAMQQARTQTRHLHRFTTKLIYNWLPTYSRIAKQQPGHTETCPLCNIERESTMHVFFCTAHPFREQLISVIDKTITDQLPEYIRDNIFATVNQNLEPIMKGLTPATWEDNATAPWKGKMIRHIWTAAHTHWKDRCKMVQELPNKHLQQQISELYQAQEMIETNDSTNIYHVPLETLLQSTKAVQTTWIQNYKSTINRITATATKTMNRTYETIVQTFNRVAGAQKVESASDLARMNRR
jgi:hypothetical protein